jgi:hypothetical protein
MALSLRMARRLTGATAALPATEGRLAATGSRGPLAAGLAVSGAALAADHVRRELRAAGPDA